MEVLTTLGIPVWTIVKIATLFGLLIYIAFAVILVKQVNLMTETLGLGHETTIKVLSKAHLLFSILVFFFTLVIL
ncbi:hypothetical protein IID22_04430 [Patescibacteria group bacterium]|nr:hypothetical protein [Patescibacteria group bacterium]